MPAHAPSCATPERAHRPRFEVADVIRRAVEDGFVDRPLPPEQAAVLRAICRCRTAALGGHARVCTDCGHEEIAYNSCRNRHCPRCQWAAQERWIARRLERVLNTPYFHVVFTLPSELRALALSSPREVYGLLFRAASRTLVEVGRNPEWLGAEVGVTMVLHTWTRDLRLHPHVHCLVTGGGVTMDGRWIASGGTYFAPVRILGALFRGKFLSGLRRLRRRGELSLGELADPIAFERLVDRLYHKPWVVYAKRPMAGPEQVITYLGRYTHRVAISNNRLLDVGSDHVLFRTRGQGTARLSLERFVRRFLLHVLPKGFVKIRHYGILAGPNLSTRWSAARSALGPASSSATIEAVPDPAAPPRCSACGSEAVLERLLLPVALPTPTSCFRPRGPPPHLSTGRVTP